MENLYKSRESLIKHKGRIETMIEEVRAEWEGMPNLDPDIEPDADYQVEQVFTVCEQTGVIRPSDELLRYRVLVEKDINTIKARLDCIDGGETEWIQSVRADLELAIAKSKRFHRHENIQMYNERYIIVSKLFQKMGTYTERLQEIENYLE